MTPPPNRSSHTPAFEAANRYLGWGEPRRGIWFIGLEEADSWFDKSEEEIVRLYDQLGEVSSATTQTDFAALGAAGRGIRHKIARIMSAVSRGALDQELSKRWRWYHNNMLWRPGSLGFQANLYPLGKPTRASWPEQFQNLFGFGPEDREAYKQAVAATRFQRLRERWVADSPLATVCFGAEAWPEFRAALGVTSPPRELAEGKVHVHDSERVVLMRFFAYGHVTNAHADAVGAVLREDWKISIP